MSPESRISPARLEAARLSAKKKTLWLRARIIGAVRGFFSRRGYLEVETPCLLRAPIPEPHIAYVDADGGRAVLQPSPEVYMKRLLAADYEKIFQICRCFRAEERGDGHLPEFTLLEWYRAGIDYFGLMAECEEMVRSVAEELEIGPTLIYRGREVHLDRVWERITVKEAFDLHSGESLDEVLSSGRFEECLVRDIEPWLGTPRPAFLHDYPASMASLSRVRPDDPGVCERVELYLGGLEIANGFTELNDPEEQARRLEEDLRRRRIKDMMFLPVPETFTTAVGLMPPAAGMALGVDRLVMILAGADSIDDVVAFTGEER
ncbi:MAG: EF-P lysine aminoacylase EpmA [Desulfobacteraceae bacterium]